MQQNACDDDDDEMRQQMHCTVLVPGPGRNVVQSMATKMASTASLANDLWQMTWRPLVKLYEFACQNCLPEGVHETSDKTK